jgi:hypothetical protein
MGESEIRDYAKRRGFDRRTLERWMSWAAADRDALATIVLNLRISENHLRDIMDWLEEIALRDHVPIEQILTAKPIGDASTDPRLGRADKVKRIKEQLRRRRYPRLARTEDEIRNRINELKLQPEIHLSVPAGLEGGCLSIDFKVGSAAELETLLTRLSQAVTMPAMAEIFELLSGNADTTAAIN